MGQEQDQYYVDKYGNGHWQKASGTGGVDGSGSSGGGWKLVDDGHGGTTWAPAGPGEQGFATNDAGYYGAINASIHQGGAASLARDKMILGRQAPTLRDNSYEFGQVTDSRNLQLEALKQQRAAAMGLGPSVAAQQNKMALGQGFNAMGAGMGGGNLLAQRQAMMGGNAMLGQASQQGAAARGGEIYGAMGAYGQGAAGLRSGDLGAQRSAFDQIAAQRQLQLNQARSNTGTVQGYEALDFDTAKSYSDLARANHARNVEAGMDSQKQTAGMAGTAATTMATLAMLAAAL